jgi:hypothetical protein
MMRCDGGIVRLFITAVVAAVVGCSVGTGPVAGGGDDFPNSLQTLGATITENLGREWSSPVAPVDDSVILAVNGSVVLPQAPTGLPKSTTRNADSLVIDWKIDSSRGLLYLFTTQVTDSTVLHDTTIIKTGTLGDTLLVSKTGVIEYTRVPVRTDRYRFLDHDGDGVLLDPFATVNQAVVTWESEYSRINVRIVSVLAVDAGGDHDFESGQDNKILFASMLNARGPDTLEFYEVTDGDGDGYAVDNARGDSSLVDMRSIKGFDPSQPLVKKTLLGTRYVLFAADSGSNYPVRYSMTEERFSGRVTRGWVVKTDSDSSFYPGDTVNLFITVKPPLADSVENDSAVMKVLLGALPNDSTDDALIGMYARVQKRYGVERDVQFRFDPAAPVGFGKEIDSGSLWLRIDYEKGEWLEINGTISAAVITAQYTDSNGTSLTIRWDRTGKLIDTTEND